MEVKHYFWKVIWVVYFIPYLLYFIFVGIPSGVSISPDGNNWNNFGGFIEGISGSLMALGNLLAFLILTSNIEDINKKRHDEQKEIQERQIDIEKKIVVSQLQHIFIKEIAILLDQLEEILTKPEDLHKLNIKLITIVNSNKIFFGKKSDQKSGLTTLIDDIESLRKELTDLKRSSHIEKLAMKVYKSRWKALSNLSEKLLHDLTYNEPQITKTDKK
jgi:hypothetical protein